MRRTTLCFLLLLGVIMCSNKAYSKDTLRVVFYLKYEFFGKGISLKANHTKYNFRSGSRFFGNDQRIRTLVFDSLSQKDSTPITIIIKKVKGGLGYLQTINVIYQPDSILCFSLDHTLGKHPLLLYSWKKNSHQRE